MQRHKLSENFYLDEFTRSQTAARNSIDNSVKLGGPVYSNIKRLARNLLQPIRSYVGPMFVSSGYRCPALNTKIGGSASSQHCQGLAVDITATGKTPLQLATLFREHGGFDQLILEFGEWVHVSIPAQGAVARGEILTAVKVPRPFRKPKTVYVRGLLSQNEALRIALGRAA